MSYTRRDVTSGRACIHGVTSAANDRDCAASKSPKSALQHNDAAGQDGLLQPLNANPTSSLAVCSETIGIVIIIIIRVYFRPLARSHRQQ